MGDFSEDKMKRNRKEREKTIKRTSFIGIAANVLLAAFKALAGYLSGSIAVALDALNSLSDAASSVVTIVGAGIAGRRPDREHPLGHGRAEYVASMTVATIILYAGITAGVEAVKKIINPVEPEYGTVTFVIMSVAVAVKIVLGIYVGRKGRSVDSSALRNSGKDALFDAVISASVLASAVVFLLSGLSLEPYVGLLISAFIVKSGIEMLSESFSDIIGRRADRELSGEIRRIICEEPQVFGAYDLIINDYGPGKLYAAVHVELPDYLTVDEVDKLTRKLQNAVYRATGVILVSVGVYSQNTKNDSFAELRKNVIGIIMSHEWALEVHGFYADSEEKIIRADVVLSFDVEPKEALKILSEELSGVCDGYALLLTPDVDV